MINEESCLVPLDLTEETLSNLIHLINNNVDGAEAELEKRIKALPE